MSKHEEWDDLPSNVHELANGKWTVGVQVSDKVYEVYEKKRTWQLERPKIQFTLDKPYYELKTEFSSRNTALRLYGYSKKKM